MYEDASGVWIRECCDEIRVVVIGIMHACRQCVLNCALRGWFQCCCWQCFFFQALVMVSMWTLKNYTHWLMFWRAFFLFFVSRSDRMDCHIADACFPLRCCVFVFSILLYFVCVLFFLWISAVPLGVDLRLRLQVCHSARSRNSEFELRSRREIKIDDRDVGRITEFFVLFLIFQFLCPEGAIWPLLRQKVGS